MRYINRVMIVASETERHNHKVEKLKGIFDKLVVPKLTLEDKPVKESEEGFDGTAVYYTYNFKENLNTVVKELKAVFHLKPTNSSSTLSPNTINPGKYDEEYIIRTNERAGMLVYDGLHGDTTTVILLTLSAEHSDDEVSGKKGKIPYDVSKILNPKG